MSEQNLNYFENDLSSEWIGKSDEDFKVFLSENILELSDQIWDIVSKNEDFKNDCIYWGKVGTAYIYYLLGSLPELIISKDKRQEYLVKSRSLISQSLDAMVAQKIERPHSFFFGNSGICLIAAIIFDTSDNHIYRDHYLNLFVKFAAYYLKIDFDDKQRDTLSEGRAGFICAALVANEIFESHIIPFQTLQNIGISVIKSGKFDALMTESKLSLVYENKNGITVDISYGMSGTLLALMCIPDLFKLHPDFESHIRSSVDHILSKQSSNGSFISEDESKDPLNWHSGSAGVCFLMAKAFFLWNDKKYKESLIKCGEFLWKRCLVRSGPGIGTGISGFGYTFLLLYRAVGKTMYLNRAKQLANYILNESYLKQFNTIKHPFSLFEGWPGVICFLIDLMDPVNTQMPLFFDIFTKEGIEQTEDIATPDESLEEIQVIKTIDNKTVPTNTE